MISFLLFSDDVFTSSLFSLRSNQCEPVMWCAELSVTLIITENIEKRRVRANIKFTSRTSTHLLWKWSLYVLCVVRSLSSFSDVSHYFASLGTFSVCFQNVKTNNCIMFMQPLVRCVQNIHKDVNDKITPTHKQTHKHTHWVLNGDSKSNVEHFAFGLLVV